jgi:putative NADH-flavin reductase
MAETILVIGATGTHGGAIASALLDRGRRVRALVRDPSSPRAQALGGRGAELVVGDLQAVGSLSRAFSEVDAVYAVTTPFLGGAREEEQLGANIIGAAQEAGLGWLLLASVAAAERAPVPHFASKARIERQLAATDLAWTVVAPSYFYENVLGSREAIAGGTLPMAVGPRTPLHQVALGDLGGLVTGAQSIWASGSRSQGTHPRPPRWLRRSASATSRCRSTRSAAAARTWRRCTSSCPAMGTGSTSPPYGPAILRSPGRRSLRGRATPWSRRAKPDNGAPVCSPFSRVDGSEAEEASHDSGDGRHWRRRE